MSTLQAQTLRPIASRMARAMLAGDWAEVRALCERLADQFSGSPPARGTAGADERQPDGRERIGIWGRDRNDPSSTYRRLEQHRSEWRLWADNDALPTPLGRRRIVLLGESAARGYLYDPTFSPAVVLQRLFRR